MAGHIWNAVVRVGEKTVLRKKTHARREGKIERHGGRKDIEESERKGPKPNRNITVPSKSGADH